MRFLLLVVSLSFFIEVSAQKKTYDTLPNLPEHYLKRVELFQREPIQEGRIIMVGNSITEGANWKVLLKDTTVINRGISGDVTFGILHRVKEITERKPSKIFILIGINDLSRNTPDEVIIENIFGIIGKIRNGSPKTSIYLESILPTNETFKNFKPTFVGKAEHILTINGQLKKYGKKMRYTYVDLYAHFVDAEGHLEANYSYDGLHLNAAGYTHLVEFLRSEKYL